VEGFVRDREASWRELDELVARSRRRFHRLGPDDVRRLGSLYRSAAADLSLARRRFPRDPVVGGLAELVGRSRHAVYASGSRRGSIVRFFARDYWRFVAERPLPLVLSPAFNGVVLGAVAGLMIGAGNWVGFVDLVTGHGVLELSCIVVAGAAGLRLGWSIVDPGRRTRAASLTAEARRTIGIVLGTTPWLVVAGIVEGFRAT